MHDRKAFWRNKNDGHTVRIAQKHRYVRRHTHDGVGTLMRFFLRLRNRLVAAIRNHDDMVPVDLQRIDQTALHVLGANRSKGTTSILRNACRIITAAVSKIQRSVRSLAHAPGAFGETERDPARTTVVA